MALKDLTEDAKQQGQQGHAFGQQLPYGRPRGQSKRGRAEGNAERSRWVIARKVHPELADWSNILKGMQDTFIGCAFSNYVNETFANAPTDSSSSKAIYEICNIGGKSPKFPRLTKPRRSKPHSIPKSRKIGLGQLSA